MTDYGKIMADAAISGFDTAYKEAQANKRKKINNEHDKFIKLQEILARSNEAMDRYEYQKALNIQQHELNEQKSEVIAKRQTAIETGLGAILGNRTMSATNKTPLVRDKILQLQQLGLAQEVNIDNIKMSEDNPDIMIMTDPQTGKNINVDTSTMFETKQGQESYYMNKYKTEGINPYDTSKNIDKENNLDGKLEIAFKEAEKLLNNSDTERHPITKSISDNVGKIRLSADQEALNTVGSTIKTMLFKKFGLTNEAEFKNLPNISPNKTKEANLASLRELKILSGINDIDNNNEISNKTIPIKCPDGTTRMLPINKLTQQQIKNKAL